MNSNMASLEVHLCFSRVDCISLTHTNKLVRTSNLLCSQNMCSWPLRGGTLAQPQMWLSRSVSFFQMQVKHAMWTESCNLMRLGTSYCLWRRELGVQETINWEKQSMMQTRQRARKRERHSCGRAKRELGNMTRSVSRVQHLSVIMRPRALSIQRMSYATDRSLCDKQAGLCNIGILTARHHCKLRRCLSLAFIMCLWRSDHKGDSSSLQAWHQNACWHTSQVTTCGQISPRHSVQINMYVTAAKQTLYVFHTKERTNSMCENLQQGLSD